MADYALSNRVDETYMLMTLCPIKMDRGSSLQSRIREVFDKLGEGDASPFRRVPGLHFCRFVIIYDLPHEGYPTKRDHLNSPYLMMSADIAGDWEVCIKSMLTEVRQTMHDVFVNCVGYPGVGDSTAFLDYLKKCQIDASFAFGAYPQASLYEVRSALDVQKRFREFVLQSQTLPPEKLQEEFLKFINQLETRDS